MFQDDETNQSIRDSIAELIPRKPFKTSAEMNMLFESLHKSMFGNISDDSETELETQELIDEESIRCVNGKSIEKALIVYLCDLKLIWLIALTMK